MFVVGLTGGIGSGKSTIADIFAEKNIDIVDADLVSREVVEPGQPALKSIAEHFGAQILDNSGRLKRADLRQLVFADKDERLWLERLLHPLINERIIDAIAASSPPYCIIVSPLLLETQQKNLANRILVVDVSRETQIQRTLTRDGGVQETIEAIIASQIDRKKRLSYADDIISNEADKDRLSKDVDALHEKYLALAGVSYEKKGL